MTPISDDPSQEPPEEEDSDDGADGDVQSEDEVDPEETHEQPDCSEEDGESSDESESDDEDDPDEPELNEADLIIRTDPWDTTGWGNEPEIKRLKRTFGDNLTVEYDVLPPRTVETWDESHEMPQRTNPELPADTRASHRALVAAREQGDLRDFMRQLRMAALVEGRDVERNAVLVDVADAVGLDVDQLEEDIAAIDQDEPIVVESAPRMQAMIGNVPHDWSGRLEFERVHARMHGELVPEDPVRDSPRVFVAEHEPVTTAEVAEAFDQDTASVTSDLASTSEVKRQNVAGAAFWVSG
ncbi:DsbA family oxidoreductase [Salinarchaeum chitinilyticum]